MNRAARLIGAVLSGRVPPVRIFNALHTAVARAFVRLPLWRSLRRKLLLATRPDAFAPKHLHAPAVPLDLLAPAPALPAKPDVFVWAVIDWHFRIQRPQHIARGLARKGHRVFYVSNEFVDADGPGFTPELLDSSARLYQVHMRVPGAPVIYSSLPTERQLSDLRHGIEQLVDWAGTTHAVSIVHHPFWSEVARLVPGSRCIYDCMDYHAGFEDNKAGPIEAETALIQQADVVTTTSSWLARKLTPHARQVAVIRNGAEHQFFEHKPSTVFRDLMGRRVVGYYGAIAHWIDLELIAEVARQLPDVLVLLVGADTASARETLAGLTNVRLEGEVPYSDLPYWLHGFDVCMLPFRITDLTLATNPVKAYEYLSAGRPVVSVDLPELQGFGGLVAIATDSMSFVKAVRDALSTPLVARQKQDMRNFARRQDWGQRVEAFEEVISRV